MLMQHRSLRQLNKSLTAKDELSGLCHRRGKTMAAAQVTARQLWLGLSNFKDQEKRQLSNSPISITLLFGLDTQNIVDRLHAASKASAQLVSHLQSCRDVNSPSRSLVKCGRLKRWSSSRWERMQPAPAQPNLKGRAPPQDQRPGRESSDHRRSAPSVRRKGSIH
ncbi:hypothetical protein WMY93_018444 [Mugilogobius chulae]|uniref:Uncharacterized protein n=1 Tax=Mugilogobius chulae TaxID=88201 RepID=A0AAW0NNW5_9GOBI